jgi:hypothetical protein
MRLSSGGAAGEINNDLFHIRGRLWRMANLKGENGEGRMAGRTSGHLPPLPHRLISTEPPPASLGA